MLVLYSFHTFHGVLAARKLEWFAIPSSSGPHFVKTLHLSWVALRSLAHCFIELHKTLRHDTLWSIKWKQRQMLFSWAQKSLQTVTTAMKLKDTCSLEEKLWQTYTVLKSRDITLPAKFCIVKAMVFPVVMHGCESWTIKKAEHWRIDAFELWC